MMWHSRVDHWCRMAGSWLLLFALLGVLAAAGTTPAQSTDPAAKKLLDSARQEFSDRNYAVAAIRFRDFLARFGKHPDAATARFGLAVCLLELPDRDYALALEQLQPLADNPEMPEHPYVLFYLGQAQRGLGTRELARVNPPATDAAKHREAARQRFEDAAKRFAAAEQAFRARVKPPAADAKELPVELEWAIRARCDQAEMLLRLHQLKEAQATLTALLKDPLTARSRSRGLALYLQGVASFLLEDYLAAGRTLNQLTPFRDPVFGGHARYLLGRVHHQTEEFAEAAAHYEGVMNDHEQNKKQAQELLKQPERFKKAPAERARLQALLKDPPPDYVMQAAFYHALLLYEAGRFADAAPRFALFARQVPRSPLAPEAVLRLGQCQVQMKQYGEAVKTLQPLAEKEPQLADLALFWLGKALVGAADPGSPKSNPQVFKTALDTLRRAAEKAKQSADPRARVLQGKALLEIADAQQLARQFKEAAAGYGQILTDNLLPARTAEVLQRQIEALALAGEYAESDRLCERFRQSYPDSALLPAVLFRSAENMQFLSQAAGRDPARAKEAAKLAEEAARRYQLVIDKFPEFEYVGVARLELGLIAYRKGEYEKAREAFERTPASDRTGEAAYVSYLLADCLLRLAPTSADDALQAGRLQEALQGAIQHLEAFVSALPNAPETPEALLRLGQCQQRLAALFADPKEAANVLTAARGTYEQFIQRFPGHPRLSFAVFERSKVLARIRDTNRALKELTPILGGPLQKSPAAPLAFLYASGLLRSQNRPEDAANLLARCRQQHEAALLQDPDRIGWAARLQYHQGVCLREAGKLNEARALFAGVVKQFPERIEADEAALREAQVIRDLALQKLDRARQLPAGNPQERAKITPLVEEALQELRGAVDQLEARAARLKDRPAAVEMRARLLGEAALDCRFVQAAEALAARLDLQLGKSPWGPSEAKARTLYQVLIEAAPDLPLANEARLGLAELLAERGENDKAIALLNDALDKEPPPDLTDRVRLLLGSCQAAKGDSKSATGQFEAVTRTPKGRWTEVARTQLRTLKEGKPLQRPGLLQPDTRWPLPLPTLCQPEPDRPSRDDPTADISLALAPLSAPAARKGPAPFLRVTLPDPFEYHQPLRIRVAPADEPLPANSALVPLRP